VALPLLLPFLMFGTLNILGFLRVHPEADRIGIDVYEHGASVWPDVYPIDDMQDETEN
jgi:ammonium transporter, Amt family